MSEAAAIRIENHSITTRDNTLLSATLYRPLDHNNYTILIAGAMGMPQRFYRHYAQFLAEQGCVVLTFDYRGIAASKQGNRLWGYKAHLADWAAQDLNAMIKWLTRQYPATTVNVIGHSVGGHLLGAASHNHAVTGLMGVSAQSTYWRHWAWYLQPIIALFWFVLIPILSYAMGYFPSSWFGLGEALPRQIALDWMRGAANEQGTRGIFRNSKHDHYEQFTGYTRFYSFTDDWFAPKKSVDAILDFYPNAHEQHRRHIAPSTVNIDKIGHLRFFRPEMRESLWQESLAWLLNPETSPDTVSDSTVPPLISNKSVPQVS